ncbi:COR domain-containing protein, partial [Candidatus Albibeggiatoa sp. nov. NOAA]|uniref:COR domain-containing protein n=1 Tax=Candidatus Albibeggiatoa sp. nov. NOAA TaxID=3162724 RepID=UPI0033034875|nr:leucine-rich repeat domain-containing protein [Thiotrichaceae bacterium]
LGHNQLRDVSPLAALTALTYLNLFDNQLSDVSPLAALTALTSLNLYNNQLGDVSPLAALTALTYLNLYNNQLGDVSPLAALTKLTTLDLCNNKSVQSLKSLLPLIEQGLEVTTNQSANTGLIIADCPITEPPQEIIEQGNAAILDYFKQIEQQGEETTQLYEAKMIIVGEGGAGKTTLMEKLFNPDYEVPQPSDSTLGIVVREGWSFPLEDNPDITFKANIWDFGGQEIQYMTHQFFLTPSALYVLVSDNRKQNTRFPYWFKIIRLLSEEQGHYSPVIVMPNNKEYKSGGDFDLPTYQKNYAELDIQQQTVDLSKNDERFKWLRKLIQQQLTKLRHVGNPLPQKWKPIREQLQQLNENHICFKQYQDICQQHGIHEKQSQLTLSGYLHKLGSILHFQNDVQLRNFIILKPQWAVDAVYSILKDETVKQQNGYFTSEYLDEVWDQYDCAEQQNLLNLMSAKNFEICYPLETEGYIAPQLLPETAPNYTEWDLQESLNFRFQYSFMPEGIVTRLIVRLHQLIHQQLVWRKGVILADHHCQAQVIEQESRSGLNVIDIAVRGNPNERKYLLSKICDEIRAIHQTWFKNIEVDEMIPCHCGSCKTSDNPHFYKVKKLQARRQQGHKTAECDESFEDVSVLGLLEGVFEKAELEQMRSEKIPEMHVHNHIHNRNLNIAGNAENNNLNQGDNIQQLAQQFDNLTPTQQAQMLEMLQNKA